MFYIKNWMVPEICIYFLHILLALCEVIICETGAVYSNDDPHSSTLASAHVLLWIL